MEILTLSLVKTKRSVTATIVGKILITFPKCTRIFPNPHIPYEVALAHRIESAMGKTEEAIRMPVK